MIATENTPACPAGSQLSQPQLIHSIHRIVCGKFNFFPVARLQIKAGKFQWYGELLFKYVTNVWHQRWISDVKLICAHRIAAPGWVCIYTRSFPSYDELQLQLVEEVSEQSQSSGPKSNHRMNLHVPREASALVSRRLKPTGPVFSSDGASGIYWVHELSLHITWWCATFTVH